MQKIIYITESQVDLIREFENKKVLHKDFEDNVRVYMEQLRTKPCKPEYGKFFLNNKIPERDLQNKMIDIGLIKKIDKIEEPKDADGKKQSMHVKKFIFSGSGFDDKIDKLYDYFFKDGERRLNECDCGGAMGDGGASMTPGGSTSTSVVGGTNTSYEYDVPVFGVIRRGPGSGKKKKKKDPSLSRPNGKIAVGEK